MSFSQIPGATTSTFKKLKTFLALAMIATLSIATSLPSNAQIETDSNCTDSASQLNRKNIANSTSSTTSEEPPEFILQAETGMAPKTFEHESFQLKSIVKSNIVVYPVAAEDKKTTYEQIWYSNGRPLGLERSADLNIPMEKRVAIKVLHPPCSTFDEAQASANVILRLMLDTLKNHNKVVLVSVPSASYTNILMELQRRKASVMPPGEKAPATAKVKFRLESSSTGLTQEVYFM